MNSLSDLQAAIREALAANTYRGHGAYRNAKAGGGQFSDAQLATAEAEARSQVEAAQRRVVAEQQQRTEAQGAEFNKQLQATVKRAGFVIEAHTPPLDEAMNTRIRQAAAERNNPTKN